jgi:hypothetical protein
MSDRLFSEGEVQKLIKRAAELEAERSVSGKGSNANGLTMDELKHVASEAGLDPQLIEQAASEMNTTSSDVKESVRVNRDEIASEIWLDHQPDSETMDVLVTELNHIYGTTDELNWWDNLWGTHEGKAKVTRTSSTTEWNYKTEAGMYSTGVLMQQRGERFRIRVSKRQIMGLEWDSFMNSLLLIMPVAVVLGVLGGVSSSAVFGTGGPGVLAGILLSLFSYPLMRHFTKRSVEKHKAEVANTVHQLSNLVLQSSNQKKSKSKFEKKARSAIRIEIPDEPESSESQSGKLRNNLRE